MRERKRERERREEMVGREGIDYLKDYQYPLSLQNKSLPCDLCLLIYTICKLLAREILERERAVKRGWGEGGDRLPEGLPVSTVSTEQISSM